MMRSRSSFSSALFLLAARRFFLILFLVAIYASTTSVLNLYFLLRSHTKTRTERKKEKKDDFPIA